ncbi:hypothetical protein SELMODRAFT_404781 [Selaginella moellendorffii]|uniref:Uncharacterized protein n=1 Tax=Selaginella moellendorffii TaxID=88036 RepID=D8QXC0_SELML|nr:hypothetical protein SELMODRAFT_404781 [Selaginella moellendorffii]
MRELLDFLAAKVWTFRMWAIGFFACAILSFLNQFFSYHTEPLVITLTSAQIVALPIGLFMAAVLHTRVYHVPFTRALYQERLHHHLRQCWLPGWEWRCLCGLRHRHQKTLTTRRRSISTLVITTQLSWMGWSFAKVSGGACKYVVAWESRASFSFQFQVVLNVSLNYVAESLGLNFY